MQYWQIYINGLYSIGIFALIGWILSLVRQNVTHVDSMWSLFLALAAITYAVLFNEINQRMFLVLFLVSIWALRLCIYLTWRNWNPHEDHRYAAIRKNNQPHFWLKSIYIVFGLQAILAWIVSMPLFGAVTTNSILNGWDLVGALLFSVGFVWETLADWQLTIFKANADNKGKVLSAGLWHFCRHPNYFGECCVWWGFYLIAVGAGAWWTLAGPVLMTLLLLKVSGVSLLEKDITERRPAYSQYIKNTSTFFPWFPKKN
jgi:steroid 5-alpha reductase family enzyme